jgi:Uma2 family endonuclease
VSFPQSKFQFTPEEYLTFERTAEVKHEYIDGFIYAMAGASPAHNQICFNLTGELYLQLRGTECRGFTSDQKIRTDLQDLFSYPDITIVCGAPLFHDNHKDVILNPKVIVEVLSPSTEARDRTEKFARYRTIKSLTDYLLIAQDGASVEHYTRLKGNQGWGYEQARELAEEIKIVSINCTLKLADIYDRIAFPPPKPILVPLSAEEVQARPAKSGAAKTKAAQTKAAQTKAAQTKAAQTKAGRSNKA